MLKLLYLEFCGSMVESGRVKCFSFELMLRM